MINLNTVSECRLRVACRILDNLKLFNYVTPHMQLLTNSIFNVTLASDACSNVTACTMYMVSLAYKSAESLTAEILNT